MDFRPLIKFLLKRNFRRDFLPTFHTQKRKCELDKLESHDSRGSAADATVLLQMSAVLAGILAQFKGKVLQSTALKN